MDAASRRRATANVRRPGRVRVTVGRQRRHVGVSDVDDGQREPARQFGTDEQIDRFVAPMLAGRFTGTMALSETQAGSSLADIVTRAEPRDDGTYRLFGSKMWISGAEHEISDNIVNLVLAKIPGGPAGTKGISLFIVPKFLVSDDGSSASATT